GAAGGGVRVITAPTITAPATRPVTSPNAIAVLPPIRPSVPARTGHGGFRHARLAWAAMRSILASLTTRLVPALLTAAGVVLVVAGLLSYTNPAAAGVAPVESDQIVTLD